ncbi:MAG: hypothetical protein ABIP21_10770 [Acidimicrobiia bacterium]
MVLVSAAIALGFWSAVFATPATGHGGVALADGADRTALRGRGDATVLARAIVRRPAPTSSPTTTATPTVSAPSPATTSTIVPPAPTLPGTSAAPAVTTTCADALAYLAAHAAPGFVSSCGPGIAMGRYGYACWNVAPQCGDGGRVIHIACPAPFVYQNEAHNSWALIGQRSGTDPYGQGSPAEQVVCDRYR